MYIDDIPKLFVITYPPTDVWSRRDKFVFKFASQLFIICRFFHFAFAFATTYWIKRLLLPRSGRHPLLLNVSTECITSVADGCITIHYVYQTFTQQPDKYYTWMLRKCNWWYIKSNDCQAFSSNFDDTACNENTALLTRVSTSVYT